MKSKLNYLIGISLKRKIKTKWFVAANIILFVVIAGVINIDNIIKLFGGDFDKAQEIYVIDNTNNSYDLFKEQLSLTDKSFYGDDSNNYQVTLYDKDLESAKKEIEKNKDIYVVEFNNSDNVIDTTVLSDGFIDTVEYQIIATAINNVKTSLAISTSNIPPEEINKLYSNVEINRIILDENKKNEDESMGMIMSTVFPVVILPFFMLTIFLVQMIGAEVNDEKTTRGMEIIISNVSPKTHFFAKVIAGNLFILIQGSLLLLFGGFGLLIRKYLNGGTLFSGAGSKIKDILDSALGSGIGDKLLYIIPLTLILMIVTFVAYSLLAGVLASMTTNTEDFQQLQTPIMILSLVGYYLSIMAGVFDGALFIRIISYVPFISAILSPSLLMLGQIGVVDMLVSLMLMVITIYILIKYGLKIYKVGILNYSSKDLWKKMFKAIKE